MGKLFAVIRREYLERVRNKWFVIVTVFGPVFFAVVMILPAYLSVRGLRDAKVVDLRVVDATGTGLGARVAQRIADPRRGGNPPSGPDAETTTPRQLVRVDTVSAASLAAAESTLVLEVMANRLSGYLILDSATLGNGQARYAGRNASSVGQNEQLETAVRSAVMGMRLENAGVVAANADSITRLRVNVAAVRITDSGKSGSGVGGIIFGGVIAFMLYIAIILYGQAILRGVLEEKTTRVAEVILASVKPDILLAGKVIGVGAVGLTQFGIWIASALFFWGERTRLIGAIVGPSAATAPTGFDFPSIEPFTIVALVLFFIFGYTLYASLFAAVGAMVGTQEEANQAVQPVMMILVFSVIFVQPVMTNPTGRLAEVLSLIPFSAPIIMPLRMTATPVPALIVMASLGGVLVTALGAIWLSARIYRVGLLMYGKRPTLRELWRWVRQS